MTLLHVGTRTGVLAEKSSCNRFSGLSGWCVQQRESRIVPKQHNDLCAVTTFDGQGDIVMELMYVQRLW